MQKAGFLMTRLIFVNGLLYLMVDIFLSVNYLFLFKIKRELRWMPQITRTWPACAISMNWPVPFGVSFLGPGFIKSTVYN